MTADRERLIAAIDALHEYAFAHHAMRRADELTDALGWEPDGFFVRPGGDWIRSRLAEVLGGPT